MATVCLWVQMEAGVFQIISGLSRIREKKGEREKFLKNQDERKSDAFYMEKYENF